MADSDMPLASLSLTHVRYDPNDPFSHVSAYLALVPQGLCVVYASLMWSTREIEVAMMFAGQMGCEALNFALKRAIREERPQKMYGKGYGMPSSHAQFVAFFAVSLTLFLLFRHKPSTPSGSFSFIERIGISLLANTGAGLVAASRVYLSYHTPKQVLVGVLAGVGFAIFWFIFTLILRRTGWIDWLLDQHIAKAFRARDLVVIEDLQEAGWIRWNSLRKTSAKVPNGRSKKAR